QRARSHVRLRQLDRGQHLFERLDFAPTELATTPAAGEVEAEAGNLIAPDRRHHHRHAMWPQLLAVQRELLAAARREHLGIDEWPAALGCRQLTRLELEHVVEQSLRDEVDV